MRDAIYILFAFTTSLMLVLNGCDKQTSPGDEGAATTETRANAVARPASSAPSLVDAKTTAPKVNDVDAAAFGAALASGPAPTIVLAQAQFVDVNDPATGSSHPKPGPACLVVLRRTDGGWIRTTIEDPDSNVFHKTTFWRYPGHEDRRPGLLAIAANGASIKLWEHDGQAWQATVLWAGHVGGTQNRLRDFEIGDVTGNGKDDIVIVTHDRGVVMVMEWTGTKWQATEIDRAGKRTFVHECELGDLDGDGRLEIYATPSRPNRFDGTAQPGMITVYRKTTDGFERRVVDEFKTRHAKEILVADTDADGTPELWALVEAELADGPTIDPDGDRIAVRRYTCQNGQYAGTTICTLDDKLARFLTAGDVDRDEKVELVASTHDRGLWLLRPRGDTATTELIDADSGGFEHATTLADLDGDGTPEIYVVADKQHEVRRYVWNNGWWQRDTLAPIHESKFTFGLTVGLW